jgi:hypothetical protein
MTAGELWLKKMMSCAPLKIGLRSSLQSSIVPFSSPLPYLSPHPPPSVPLPSQTKKKGKYIHLYRSKTKLKKTTKDKRKQLNKLKK